MISREVTINSKVKKGSFPITKFIDKAKKFNSKLEVAKGDFQIDATSLMGLLSLQLAGGMKVTVIGCGKDEGKAVKELAQFLAEVY